MATPPAPRKRRLPRSTRKSIRRQKAALRRTLEPAEATRAIERIIRHRKP